MILAASQNPKKKHWRKKLKLAKCESNASRK